MAKPGSFQGVTILQVIPDLAAGGAERTTLEVAEAIVANGGRAIVASKGGRLEHELGGVGGELIRFPNLPSKNPLTIYDNAGVLAQIVKKEQVNLIHARSRAPAWSAYWASNRTGRPFVTTYHGAYGGKSGLKQWYNSVMARGDTVIANSHYIADHVAERYPWVQEKIKVIPRGVDIAAFDPDAVSHERLENLKSDWFADEQPPGPVILLPGRLTRWKGQLDAIHAMKLRRDQVRPDQLGVLILAGDDQGRSAYVEELKAAVLDNRLENCVKLVGHCADMPAAFLIASVVMAPSREPEAFGRVAAEAGAIGAPVIAADHGGQKEVVIDGVTGILVRPSNPDILAKAITAIVDQSPRDRQTMSQAAAAHIRAHYTKNALQDATLSVYADLLSRQERAQSETPS